MNYIFYQTKTKYTNVGDALINKALISQLRCYGKIYANCSSDIPDTFLEELGIRKNEKIIVSNEIKFSLSIMAFVIRHPKDKIYIFSGLGDSYGGGVVRVTRNIMSGILYAGYRMLGIETVRIGRSVGTYTKGMVISERFRSRFTSFNYLRDTQSLNKCKDMNFKRVQFCPDMSWLYLYGGERKRNVGNTIAFFMRASVIGKYNSETADMIIKKCGEMLRVMSAYSTEKLHLIFAYQVIEDKKLAFQLYEEFNETYECEYIDEQLDLQSVENVYGRTEFHISNRLHSLLLGYKYGSIPIALLEKDKHYKITSTFEDCGLDDLMFDLCDDLVKRENIVKVMEHKDIYYNQIVDLERHNVEVIQRVLKEDVFGEI